MLKLIYQFTGSFRYDHLSEELANTLTKNLIFLCKWTTDAEELEKVFKKSSYVGGKLLGS